VKQDFQVEVRGDHIIVTFVGTSFCELSEAKEGASLVAVGLFKTSRGNLSPSGGIYRGCASPTRGPKSSAGRTPISFLHHWLAKTPASTDQLKRSNIPPELGGLSFQVGLRVPP
jgi:hypothetical protein